MLKDKVLALAQEPAAAAALAPRAAARLRESFVRIARDRVRHGSLIDACSSAVRDKTSLDVKRADFKLDMLRRTCS
jgi:ATP-dependent helicase HrpA